jgi:uncharacterized protein
MSESINAQPTRPTQRILALDALRGFAILGILIMNIQSFSMPEAAYFNPTAYGDLTGLNKWVWILSHMLADQKFMTIFSMLFGAGIILFTTRAEAKGRSALKLHYRRTFWLLVIGLMHAYLLWSGDILVPYALCALVVVLFRKWSPTVLAIVGLVVIAISSLIYLFFHISIPFMPPEGYDSMLQSWQPSPEMINHEVTALQGSWLEQMSVRVPATLMMQLFVFFIFFFWRAGGLMLVGMALFKWDVLTGERSKKFYAGLTVLGLGLGWLLVGYGVAQNFAANWLMEAARFGGGYQFNYWGSLLVSSGYIGLIMLLCKSTVFTPVTNVLGAVGRMALTNYLLQTLICTTIFYGHGFGLFGQVERTQQVFVVVGVWALQLIISPLWLRYFRFGPAEWVWRSLTYWKLQPMKKMQPADSPELVSA